MFFGKGLPEIGTWLEVKLAKDGDEIEVLEAHKIDEQTNGKVATVEGNLKLNSKGFGFIDDAFIAPFLLKGYQNQEFIRAIKIWDLDPKKGTPSWRVIKVEKSNLSNE